MTGSGTGASPTWNRYAFGTRVTGARPSASASAAASTRACISSSSSASASALSGSGSANTDLSAGRGGYVAVVPVPTVGAPSASSKDGGGVSSVSGGIPQAIQPPWRSATAAWTPVSGASGTVVSGSPSGP